MNLTKNMKLLLGAATVWPIVYMFVFMAFVLSTMTGAVAGGHTSPSTFVPFALLHIFTMLEGLGLLVFYVVHAIQNKRLDQNTRLLWAILIFVGSIIAMPIYYFLHVWPNHSVAAQ